MKKIYLFAATAFLFGSVHAQRVSSPEFFTAEKANLETFSPRQSQESNNERATPIWEEDFSGGTGLTTSQGTWTTEGAQGSYWTIGANPHPLNGFGWTNAMDAEYLAWDSYNPNDSEGAFATTPVAGAIYSPTIDLSSATNGAVLRMDVETMYCCNFQETPWYIEISTDDGVTWSAPVPIDFGVDRNDPTEDIAHPLNYVINISAYLDPTPANNNDCRIKFVWEGMNIDGNGQANTHYFWLIDDVAIEPVADHEVDFISSIYGNQTPDPIFGENMVYSMIPDEQIDGIDFMGVLNNFGANSETNVAFNVTVTDGGGSTVYTGSSAGATIPASDTLYDTTTVAFTPGATPDTYTAVYDLSYDNLAMDDNPANNTTNDRSFSITDNEYARDYGIYTTAGISFDADPSGSAYPYIVGTSYEANAAQQLDRLKIAVSDDTEVGALVYAYIVEMDPAAATIADLLSTGLVYDGASVAGGEVTITNAMISTGGNLVWVNIPIVGGITLNPGSNYFVGISTPGGDLLEVMPAQINPQVAFLYDASDSQGNGSPTWFNTDAPMIRAVFDIGVGIDEEELGFTLAQNIPNPTNATSEIRYQLADAGEVSLNIVDVTGKEVYSQYMGQQSAGSYNVVIDAATFEAGIYYYTLTVEDKRITKKMMVTK